MGAGDCGTNHNYKELSFFSATVSLILCITTIPTSCLIIAALYKSRNTLFTSTFYKIVLNIVVSDLMTGLIGDTGAVNFLIREGLMMKASPAHVYWVHIPLFLNGGVSILTLSILSLDRVVALLRPFKYRDGVKPWKVFATLSLTWVTSGLLTIVYFYIGYIKYLMVYAFTTVLFSTACLIFTTIVYRKKFRTKTRISVVLPAKTTAMSPIPTHKNSHSSAGQQSVRRDRSKTYSTSSQMERRVNSSFIIILLLFLLTYLPACIMTIYMNVCTECNCLLIHVLRDLTFLLILASALLRGINFISRLTTIRRAIRKMLGFRARNLSEVPISSIHIFSQLEQAHRMRAGTGDSNTPVI